MNRALVDPIADAVLYEGYILYPYRPSVKNRQRWTFGGLCPQSYSAAQGDAWSMQTECLLEGGGDAALTVSVPAPARTSRDRVGFPLDGVERGRRPALSRRRV